MSDECCNVGGGSLSVWQKVRCHHQLSHRRETVLAARVSRKKESIRESMLSQIINHLEAIGGPFLEAGKRGVAGCRDSIKALRYVIKIIVIGTKLHRRQYALGGWRL